MNENKDELKERYLTGSANSTVIDVKARGISTFFLWSIPLTLGLAASIWFGVFRSASDYHHESVQLDRHAELVGAKPLPVKKMEIIVHNKRGSCAVIDRAEIDGGELYVYYSNVCGSYINFINLEWKVKSPDATIVENGSEYLMVTEHLDRGERAEYKGNIKVDSRAASLELNLSYEHL